MKIKNQILVISMILLAIVACKKDEPLVDDPQLSIVGNVYILPSGFDINPYYKTGIKVISKGEIIEFEYRIMNNLVNVKYELSFKNPKYLYVYDYPNFTYTDLKGNKYPGLFSFETDKLSFADGSYILYKRGTYSELDKMFDEIH